MLQSNVFFLLISLIGERELRTYHLPPFQAAVEEAKVSAIMPSYNELDGILAHINLSVKRSS